MVFSWRLQVQKTTRLRVLFIVERLFSLRQQVHKTTSAFHCRTTKDLLKDNETKRQRVVRFPLVDLWSRWLVVLKPSATTLLVVSLTRSLVVLKQPAIAHLWPCSLVVWFCLNRSSTKEIFSFGVMVYSITYYIVQYWFSTKEKK